MHNLIDYLSQGLSRSFKVTFTILFIVINLSVITVNTIYINDTIATQNESLSEMVEHLMLFTDEETALTYLEHYGHTHDVFLEYVSADGNYDFITETPPGNGEAFTIMVDGEVHGTLYVDNAQSDLFMANLTYLIIVNIILVALYVSFMLFLNQRMKKQNARIIKDMRHLQRNIDAVNFTKEYDFAEFKRIEGAFEETMKKIDRLQQSHRNAIQSLAHEIKTPLTIIRGYIDGLAQGRLTADDSLNQSIEEETARISELIEKIIEGSFQETHQLFDMSELTRNTVERQRLLFDQKNVRLHHDITSNVKIVGDADAMRRVLEHLLQNSSEHTPEGESVKITLNDSALMVEDTGRGMDEATLSQVFKRTKSDTGSGVGLMIVKSILDAHGFDVDIDSKPSEGTRITVRFRS